MSFLAAVYLIVLILSLSLVSLVLWMAARSYLRFRGKMLVTCPETGAPVAVSVNTLLAALTAPVVASGLRLQECSRWPERKDCGQECLAQIEASPEDCLGRNIFARWYEGKTCIFCGKNLGEIDSLLHKPTLRSSEGVTYEWREIEVESLPEILATHSPVCWNCHIADTFRRKYPHLVVDRPWRAGEHHRLR